MSQEEFALGLLWILGIVVLLAAYQWIHWLGQEIKYNRWRQIKPPYEEKP